MSNTSLTSFLNLQITEEVQKLLSLKNELSEDPRAGGKLILKTAKGTRDFQPDQVRHVLI